MGQITQLARQLRKNPTPAEKILWEHARKKKISGYKLLRQQPIIYKEIDEKKYFFIADFCCYQSKLIIEVDGGIHTLQKDYDEARDFIVAEMGFKNYG